MAKPKLVERDIRDLYVRCSLQVRNHGAPGAAASDNCGRPATSGVVDPETKNVSYRCVTHEGFLSDGSPGEVVTTILRMAST